MRSRGSGSGNSCVAMPPSRCQPMALNAALVPGGDGGRTMMCDVSSCTSHVRICGTFGTAALVDAVDGGGDPRQEVRIERVGDDEIAVLLEELRLLGREWLELHGATFRLLWILGLCVGAKLEEACVRCAFCR